MVEQLLRMGLCCEESFFLNSVDFSSEFTRVPDPGLKPEFFHFQWVGFFSLKTRRVPIIILAAFDEIVQRLVHYFSIFIQF